MKVWLSSLLALLLGPVRRWRCDGCGKVWDQRRSPANVVPLGYPRIPPHAVGAPAGPWHGIPLPPMVELDGFVYGSGRVRPCGPVLEGRVFNIAAHARALGITEPWPDPPEQGRS